MFLKIGNKYFAIAHIKAIAPMTSPQGSVRVFFDGENHWDLKGHEAAQMLAFATSCATLPPSSEATTEQTSSIAE